MPKQAVGRKRGGAGEVRSRRQSVQYTVRGVPAPVDSALRARARGEHKSLNALLREALARAAGVGEDSAIARDDLDHLAGRWREDREFDRAIAAQDQVDRELWR